MVFYLLDLAGVAVFAASGVLAARDCELDLLGVVTVATLTAVGGGTLRDLLLSRHPIFWITDPMYLVVILAATAVTVAYLHVNPAPGMSFLFADALGLAFFALLGASFADEMGVSPIISIIMGTMTGVTGGMLRDVLTARVPVVMRKEIYATAAMAGIAVFLILQAFGVPHMVAFWIGVVIVAALRMLAIRSGVHLPTFYKP